jgi:lysophospholipase L1-like esterase
MAGASQIRAPGGVSTRASGNIDLKLRVGLVVILVLVLLGLDAVVLVLRNPSVFKAQHYYLALGNSISFGYQPDLDFTDGFVDQIFAQLHKANVTDLANYACAGESTTTMIHGNCPARLIHHNAYSGAQLDAATAFLKQHVGAVNPVTLDIGSNDVLNDFNIATCSPAGDPAGDLARMDANLTDTILPRLLDAMKAPKGVAPTDFLMLNYYNPYAKVCPNSATFAHQLNDHLAADARQFRIPIVDVYAAFGGDSGMASHICAYTWICDPQFADFHPTTAGYKVISDAVLHALNYPGVGPNLVPLPHPAPLQVALPADERQRPRVV